MTTVKAPAWKWEWNLNTIVILIGFAGGIAAWGATWARLTDGQSANRAAIDRIDKRVTSLEALPRLIDNHEFRIGNVEKQATDSATAMRAVESTLNSPATDMRVTREILQRIEASQSGRGR
ncbi:hypothetical protein DFR48_10553 [Ciceribacter lividus]|uniref:Uncharacterized protein n=1 Tax=Ciceribacter lividus TaxID=1197950 RepID=A0A6I7HN53_9HYPH|nr:hypothetical protein [Ciceribacter lividus]RCW24715.1 hypothetical protein DFR48_10553 [Ciceribacter lividus]